MVLCLAEDIAALGIDNSEVEVTVAQKLNQGERKKSAVYLFFLDFLVLFYQEKSTEKNLLLRRQKVNKLLR